MKIGLIVANPITNYGAHLQAFATQHVIDSLGHNTEIIDYTKIKNYTHYYLGRELLVRYIRTIKKLFIRKNISVLGDEHFLQNKKERTHLAVDFRNRRLHDIIIFKTYRDLVKHSGGYDAVLIGSDQMWLPGTSLGPFHSLRFAPKGVARVSYATSLGVSSYPRICWESAMDMWENMNYISVREEQGAKIIREICGNEVDVHVVVDPTYLMTKQQWEEAIPFIEVRGGQLLWHLPKDLQCQPRGRFVLSAHADHLPFPHLSQKHPAHLRGQGGQFLFHFQ